MKIRKELDELLSGTEPIGTFPLHDLVSFAARGTVTGLAVARDEERAVYIALVDGEPEGAVYCDEDGELYGDKAAVRLSGKEEFTLHRLSRDIIDALVMGCRIFEPSYLKTRLSASLPEIGKIARGLGILTVAVRQGGRPGNGLRVSVRKDGSILGSDVTTGEGTVSFRLLHGDYDCIVQDRAGSITTVRMIFDAGHPLLTVDI